MNVTGTGMNIISIVLIRIHINMIWTQIPSKIKLDRDPFFIKLQENEYYRQGYTLHQLYPVQDPF